MKKRIIKIIICIMLISALMIGFCSAYASAATPTWLLRAKAGIAAALMAANIAFEPVGALHDQALANVIDPLGIVQTVQDTAWTDYLDQSVIVVRPDYVTIDGVQYSEIWLGSDATNSLRASGFDFKTAYNILSNQNEALSYANGAGFWDGLPVYLKDGIYQTQAIQYPNTTGTYALSENGVVQITKYQDSRYHAGLSYDNTFWTTIGSNYNYDTTAPFKLSVRSSEPYSSRFHIYWMPANSQAWSSLDDPTNKPAFTASPFEFDYTSGVIDTTPIDQEEGLLLRVPSSYDDGDSTSIYNYDIHDFVINYPSADEQNGHELIFDPSLNPDFDVDIDMGNALGDIITAIILAKLADLLDDNSQIIYNPMPEKDDPTPDPGIIDPLPDPDPTPDDPTPGTTIANTDWTKLDELLRWIQSTIDSIRHLTESLQTMLDNIIEAFQDVMIQISEISEAIRELADKILEDIELGPSKLFDKALDILKTLFLPILLPIRAMMNLWHYVVEWIQSISTPFTWIFGLMSSTSYNMVLPIYAVLAGGICISIYKALGR